MTIKNPRFKNSPENNLSTLKTGPADHPSAEP